MKKSLHTKSIYRSNLVSDIRIAAEAGYQGVEMVGTKIMSFLEAGFTSADCKALLDRYNMSMCSVVDIAHVERTDKESVERMQKEAHIFSKFAQDVGCPSIQLVPLCAHEGKSWDEVKRLTASSVNRVLDIGPSTASVSSWSPWPSPPSTPSPRAWSSSTTPAARISAWSSTSGTSGTEMRPRPTRWPRLTPP